MYLAAFTTVHILDSNSCIECVAQSYDVDVVRLLVHWLYFLEQNFFHFFITIA